MDWNLFQYNQIVLWLSKSKFSYVFMPSANKSNVPESESSIWDYFYKYLYYLYWVAFEERTERKKNFCFPFLKRLNKTLLQVLTLQIMYYLQNGPIFSKARNIFETFFFPSRQLLVNIHSNTV